MRIDKSAHSASIAGFSMIELMITVAIIGILAMVALPSYNEYITRSKLVDAHQRLGDLRVQMEKFFQDNRTYMAGATCGIALNAMADANTNPARLFDYTCPVITATTYRLDATGRAVKGMTGFVFSVDQNNVRTSVGPGGWTPGANCWFVRKSGDCS